MEVRSTRAIEEYVEPEMMDLEDECYVAFWACMV
jgi:hypothetical protein